MLCDPLLNVVLPPSGEIYIIHRSFLEQKCCNGKNPEFLGPDVKTVLSTQKTQGLRHHFPQTQSTNLYTYQCFVHFFLLVCALLELGYYLVATLEKLGKKNKKLSVIHEWLLR